MLRLFFRHSIFKILLRFDTILTMNYKQTARAVFLSRPNRFIAKVLLDGKEETVHVKNTGRCRELLFEGNEVCLALGEGKNRKTKWDLIGAKKNGRWVNIDSQAINQALKEWLEKQNFDSIRPETTYGNSRFDFCLQKNGQLLWVEAKGCTLEEDGIGYFPDAPTARGTKHLQELTQMAKEGQHCAVCFVIAVNGVKTVHPNSKTDPVFTKALLEASRAGVAVWHARCEVKENGFFITEIVEQRPMFIKKDCIMA